jgi:hypothetical protein
LRKFENELPFKLLVELFDDDDDDDVSFLNAKDEMLVTILNSI